jgi:hypothetical protein
MSVRGALVAVAAYAGVAFAGDGAREVHGVADAFAQPGVSLAWGVLRGKSDADTLVVIRIETTAPGYAFVAVDGVDPFTQQRKPLEARARVAGGIDLAIPRTHFADYPRTELRFAPDQNGAPVLVVYYLGVPDTTPELPTQDALARSLADRLARARATAGTAK